MPRERYHQWTPEREQYLIDRRAEGWTAREIAEAMGMTQAQVANKSTLMGARAPLGPRRPSVVTMPVAPPAVIRVEPDRDPVAEAQARREHVKALREEREELEAVAGERSLRAMLDTLFRDVVPAVDPPPRYRPPKAGRGAVEETALFHWSDWHYGEVVLSERVRGYNAYDQDVAAGRIRSTVANGRGILERLRVGGYRFDRAVIAANGDLVTGTIHELEKHSNGKTIVESVVECGYLLAEAIRDVAADFARVDVFCTVGNHGRFPDQRRMEQKAPLRNWDALVYHFAKVALRDVPHVTVEIPNAYAVGYEIDGHSFLQQHGHDIKSWAGIPFYGIQRYTSRVVALEASRDRRADYFLFGHFHTATSLPQPSGELFVNGSLIGATEYSVNALGAADRPAQWLVGVHPEHGVTHRWPVYPDAPAKRRKAVA
jgi:hypothetical protein